MYCNILKSKRLILTKHSKVLSLQCSIFSVYFVIEVMGKCIKENVGVIWLVFLAKCLNQIAREPLVLWYQLQIWNITN